MSGHSKWHNIKHKKAAADAKKSKVYTKVWKLIEIAARWWADPSLNPNLEAALQTAKYNSVPKEVIERAIKKWSGQSWGEQLEEVYYEWYGPAWVALYIKCITSNKNRTWSNIRSSLTKFWWNMWEPWCVSWQFKEKWVIYITWIVAKRVDKWKDVEDLHPLNIDNFEMDILEVDVEDYEVNEEWVRVVTSRDSFIDVRDYLDKKMYKIEWADLEYLPENYVSLSDEESAKLERIIEIIEDDEDVDTVYHNAE